METTAPAVPTAKPKTLDEVQDEDVKSNLNFYKEYLETELKYNEEDYNDAKKQFDSKNPIVRFFSKKPSYEQYTQYTKDKLELLKNNPEQYISDAVKEYEYSKKAHEKDGEEFPQVYQKTLDSLKKQLSKLQEENAVQKSTTEAAPAETTPKQISRGDLKISVDGTTQGLGNIITENYSEKEDGPIKDNRFSVSARNPVKVESTVKDNGNTELNVTVSHPDNFGRQGAVQFKIEIPKGVEVSAQEIQNLIKEKTKQVKLDPQKDGANYKRGVESYLNDIVDNILKPKENAVQKPTTEEGVLRTEQPQVGLPTVGQGNTQQATTQEGVTPAKTQEVKPIEQELSELEQMFPTEGPTGENRGVAASNNQAMDEMASRATDERVKKVIKTAQRLTKTLKSLFPTADINLHETEDSYNGAMEQNNGVKGSNGNFAFGLDTNGKPFIRIDINTSKATSTDVAHEVAHAVLQKTFGDNQKLFKSFQEKIAKVLSSDKNQRLLDFANNPAYQQQGVTYEEYMAELKAILSEEGGRIELSTAKKIAAVINEYVSRITKGAFKPFQEVTDVKQVVDFVNKVTEAMAKGEEIDVEGAAKMGEGSRSSIKVFQGTPYEFEKFSTEKIGTGEGAQAFGWGLYFTDVRDIANYYAESVGLKNRKQSGIRYPRPEYIGSQFLDIINKKNKPSKSEFESILNKEKQRVSDEINNSNDVDYKTDLEDYLSSLNKIKSLQDAVSDKIVYDVTLHEGKTPDQYTYLEWDKPVGNEIKNKVNSAISNLVEKYSIANNKYLEYTRELEQKYNNGRLSKLATKDELEKRTQLFNERQKISDFELSNLDLSNVKDGQDLYFKLKDYFKSDKQASLFLLENGIDGVKYPAESISRGATSENARGFNYVVFDENAISINSVSRSSLRTQTQVDDIVKQARASGYSEKAIEEFLNKRGVDPTIIEKSLGKKAAGTKIVTNEEMMPGYDKMMEDVNSEILRGLDRKTKETTIEKNVMKIVEGSEAYKNATDQQREQIVRDVKEAFGEKMKQGPSADTITGKKEKQVTVNETQALKDQIKLEIKAAKEGASSVREAVKKIRDFVVKNKDVANLTRKDLLKVIDIIKNVKDEKTLESASKKITDIIDNANKDIIEVSKTKMEAQKTKAELKAAKEKMKAELKAAKEGAKGVVNKVKAIKKYFDSVKEYGNLTRRDLTRVMAEIAKVKDEETLDKAVNKINEIIDNAKSDKIEISEKKMIANTIKEVKLAKGNIKEKRKLITDVIDNIKKAGKLSAAQVNALLKRANNLNVESFEHLNKFIDYAEKIFADAEYQNKLSKANTLKGSIKKSSKNKSNKYDANLVRLAERFLSIDPSLVENIDEYNKMASDVAEAIKGSSTKGFKPTVEIKSVDAYIEETMKAQKEKLTDMMREQVEELLGVDGSTLTYDEMIKMMESEKKDMSEQKEKIIRSAAIKLFESLSSNIEYILEKGKDPFTGEDVDIKESKKDVVKRFMDMDLTKMDIKDAIAAVDALNNFIVNQSTAKMDDVVSKYEGRQNNAEVNSKGIVSKPLRLYFNKYVGRVMIEQFANLPIVFERLFKSPTMGAYVQKMMGVTELLNNKSKAEAIVKSAVNKFTDKFYKDKANGENFNSSFNNLERGVFADLYRTIIGTPEQVKQEFERNKGLLEQTIKKLSRGTEAQKKESEILQKVYDKIVKDSDSIEDVKSKMDAKNVEAVEYWVEKWAEHYEDLADVSENVYNRILDKELNYTPKRMSKIKEDNSLETEESAFHRNNGTIFKKSTGSLMEATRPDELPENRYVDYSFDSKMANSFQDALVDVYTAANIRKVEAFIKDKGFEEIFPNAEDRQLLEKRIKLMVDNFRNKNHYDYNELNKGMKYVNKLGNIGVAAALGGVFQPIKQTVPVAINTLVNAGGINMDRIFSKSYKRVTNEFLDKSGYAIANRGKESTSDIKAIDTMIEDVAKNAASKGVEWTTKKLGKIQDFYLKKLLVNPDVAIARMSWLTYYEKSLKEQGKDVENIDYSDHELNKDAADYAQKMVDRQQNVSDADLKGDFFSNKSAANQIISKVIFPFASFRINQSSRLASDFITLTSKTATEGDRAIAARSLAGATAEIAAFNAIGAGLTTLLYSVVKSMIADDDEDEEDKKKREEIDDKYIQNLIKGRATSAVQDFISPLPLTDYLIQKGVYNTIDVFNGEEKKGKENEQFNILKPRSREGLQSLGTLGIFPLRMYDLYSITSMASSGTFEDDYGNTKNIRQKDKSVLKNVLIPLATINSTGALPAESYTIQNIILKDIKKRASTQTEAEIIQEKAKKRESRADNIEKIQVINRAINTANDQAVVNELLKMRRETRMELFPQKMSDEAKEVLKRKKEREKAKYKGLLGGYDTKSDLKRYDPDLYEQNFGEGSDYYDTHKAEVKAEKLFDAMMKKTKDEKYGYTPKPKKKGKTRKKNSDGSYSRSSYRYYSK
jgi:hypothetical protein